MHSFKHLESNIWWSLLISKHISRFCLPVIRRCPIFWKSTWKIDSNFHIKFYQPFHFVTLHVTENAISSWNMMSIVFTKRNRCFLNSLVTRLWSKLDDIREVKWYFLTTNDLFDFYWKLKWFAVNPSACFEFSHIYSFDQTGYLCEE